VVIAALAGASASSALALGAGDLDPTFAGDGYAPVEFGTQEGAGSAIAPAPEGKVLMGVWAQTGSDSKSALVRFLHDGSLDPSFGTNGIRLLENSCGSGNEQVDAIHVLGDGQILTAGTCDDDFILRRFNSDGSDDQSFDGDPGNPGGGNGIVMTAFPESAGVNDMAVNPTSGAITLAGTCCTGGPHAQSGAFARYLPDGTLDPSFDGDSGNPAGGNGKVVIDLDPARDDRPEELVELPDGGFAFTTAAHGDSVVVEIDSDGKIRKSFGNKGIVTIPGPNEDDSGESLALQGTNLVVAIATSESPYRHIEVRRVTASGSLDSSFGPTVFDFGKGQETFPAGLEVAADGSIYLAADAELPYPSCECGGTFAHTLLARLLPDGAPDPSFGPGGYRLLAGPQGGDTVRSLALDAEGSILLSGSSFPFPAEGKIDEQPLATRVLAAEPKPSPSNAFKIGKLKLNKRKGTATLTVVVPGSGVVTLAGTKKLKPSTRSAGGAGNVTLAVKPTGKAGKKLAHLAKSGKVGRLKLKLTVSFTPTGGAAASLSKKLTLVRVPAAKKKKR
jgi:uncharacterized delta-60 repeat protein